MRAILLFAITLLLASDNRVTIHIPFEPGEAEQVAVVTFDPNRVSAEDVEGWMKLAEEDTTTSPTI